MIGFFRRLLRGGKAADERPVVQVHPRLSFAAEPAAIYAIGDIHGRLDLLRDVEQRILADGAAIPGEKWLVTLGDHIDRGPHSSGVLDHLAVELPAGWRRFCLCGNHELEMLDFLARPASTSPWLGFGGIETLLSYGVPSSQVFAGRTSRERWRQLLDCWVPPAHIEQLAQLPLLLETPHFVLVHAGIVPGRSLAAQRDLDLVSYRDDFASDFAGFGKTVVHGHQVRSSALLIPTRIALDTGAYATGVLTAARLAAGQPPTLITATGPG
ncbi:MAG TPA: metallophosphoesterase, partial [Alphaproteobacteria bacterium]|nr:metallophosphoesterase [Alphaproteobacteria bacterium]